MNAIQYSSYGGIDVLQLNENVEKPTVSPNHIVVRVKAASINPIDWKVREGFLKEFVPLHFPVTIGGDFSGVVEEVGKGVTEFKAGDEVFGQGGVLNGGSGSCAKYVLAAIGKVSVKPQTADFQHAAALPLVGVSALQAIEDHIKIQTGQKILIHGGAGGIGSTAIQIAKSHGAYVATTVGTKDVEFAKELGADEVIDYKTQQFETLLKDFDAVFDTSGGGETITKSYGIMKKGGVLVSMAEIPDATHAKELGIMAIGQSTDANPDRLARLSKLVESGVIHIQIDTVFPLEQYKEAFTYQETGHPRGKVVLTVAE